MHIDYMIRTELCPCIGLNIFYSFIRIACVSRQTMENLL